MTKKESRFKRKLHIKKKLSGTAEKPRVYVFKSNKYTYVGVADDITGKVAASLKGGKKIQEAEKLGEEFGKVLKSKSIEKAVFDRSGYKFHGRVKSVADGLIKSGVKL